MFLHTGARIGFKALCIRVDKFDDDYANLIVIVVGDQLATNAEVVVRFYTSPGTALSGQ